MPTLIVLLITIAAGFACVAVMRRPETAEATAQALLHAGAFDKAEAGYADLVRKEPSVPLVIALIETHAIGVDATNAQAPFDEKGMPVEVRQDAKMMSEEELDAIIANTPPDIAIVAHYWLGVVRHAVTDDARAEIVRGAAREPPVPWHNHLLAREAEERADVESAAEHYFREGLAFDERKHDVNHALSLLLKLEAWDRVRDSILDPKVAKIVSPLIRYRIAVHDHDWLSAVRWLAMESLPPLIPSPLILTSITALAWIFFCLRLGKVGERPALKLALYLVAFALGVLSVVPTLALIGIEEATLRIVETGDPARDILFYVFGVGLREEASKLALFLPLLFVVRRYGGKLDVLVTGALVGLGFAATENLGYLASGNLHTGLGRFLTANFLHMAMTGILATALDDFVADRERFASDFSRTTLMVVGLHGAYDFLLAHEEFGGTYMAMVVFVFLTKLFLNAVDHARRHVDRGISILHAFLFAVAVVTGVTFVFATVAVGPTNAAIAMTEGLLGVAIIVFVFVRTLRTM